MVKILYGASGCGKTTEIYNQIADDLKNGKRPFLIVPDQHILNAESAITDICKDISTFELEIVSFRRLANHVFRKLGGLSFNDIDESGRLLVMWRVIREVSPFLKAYTNIDKNETSFAELMLNTITDLKQFSNTPSDLEKASKKLEETHPELSRKLQDISFIYGTFQSFLSKEFNDPTDELNRLSDTLENSGFFNGHSVYFDSFDGFTPQQLGVIKHIIKQADETVFTVCYDPDDKSGLFATTHKTFKTICKVAETCGQKAETRFVGENKSFESEDIAYVAKNLWAHDVSSDNFKGDKSNVNTICCQDIYEECEVLSANILKKVREGARFKDIVIIARDISSYEGVLDIELQNNGIPFHMSKRTDLSAKPIFKLILAAFVIKNRGWRYSDVISYLKSGLAGVSYDEIDLLENYVSSWNINGKRWTDGYDWHMNPDGFQESISESGKQIIDSANNIKKRIVPSLVKFHDSIGGTTVKDVTKALYTFLSEMKIKEQIEQKAMECRKRNDLAEEKELVQLWNILVDTLDMIVDLAGDMKINGEDYLSLISMILSKTDIGTIPASIDQVILGSASSLRTNTVPHVYLLGVNEGVFPMAIDESNIFSDNEKEILKGLEIEISPQSDELNGDELYWFYKSLSRAKKTLTILYPTSDLSGAKKNISVAGSRIGYLLDKKTIEYQNSDDIEKIEGKSIAIKMLGKLNNPELCVALNEYLSSDDETAQKINSFNTKLYTESSDIDSSLAKEIYKGDISTSQSKLDDYVNCSFSYHCKNILRLGEQKTSFFRGNDIGNFVHIVLERVMARLTDEDGFHPDIDDECAEQLVREVVAEYIKNIMADSDDTSPRLTQLMKRLHRTTLLLVRNILEEFRQSDFVPSFFELPIGNYEGEDCISPYKISLDDGSNIYLIGRVDRVDTYKKGKDVYVRVIDYKTGSKTFNLNDVEKGLNLQMLLYLFAIWNSKEKWFKEKIKCDGEILPAGILYYMAQSPRVDVYSEKELESIYGTAQHSIEKKGLLIKDLEVLRAMDKDMSKVFIPFGVTKKGELSKSENLMTIEEMGELSSKIDRLLNNIATEMKNGKVNAKPLEEKEDKTPCRFCRMKPICRRVVKGEDDDE